MVVVKIMGNDTTELSLASLELDKLEACVELMFFAAYADGTVDPAERAKFEEHALRATRGQLQASLIQAVLGYIEGTVQGADRTDRVLAIAERLPDERVRRAALSLAAQVAMADGEMKPEERTFLVEAARAFGIPEAEIDELARASA